MPPQTITLILPYTKEKNKKIFNIIKRFSKKLLKNVKSCDILFKT